MAGPCGFMVLFQKEIAAILHIPTALLTKLLLQKKFLSMQFLAKRYQMQVAN